MRALLLSLALLLTAAPAAAAQDALDEAAQALGDDTVYVDPAVQSDLDADELRNAISERGVDVRIAVLPESAGNPGRLARELAERVGEPGDYVVVAGNRIIAGPSADAGDAAEAAAAANGSAQAVLLDFVDRMAGEQGGGEDEGGVGAGGLILLGLAGAGGAAMVMSRRKRRQDQAAELAEVKDNVRDDLVVLGDEIRALDLDIQMPDVPPEARADYETAVNAYDRASRRASSPGGRRISSRSARRSRTGRWAMKRRAPGSRAASRPSGARRASSIPGTGRPPATSSGRPRAASPATSRPARRTRCASRAATTLTRARWWWAVSGCRTGRAAGAGYAPFMGGFYGAGTAARRSGRRSAARGRSRPATSAAAATGAAATSGADFGGGDFGG